jgi:hypothetical protein
MEGSWGAFAGGSLSVPADMMLERDMGSARVGGGAWVIVSKLEGGLFVKLRTSSFIDGRRA